LLSDQATAMQNADILVICSPYIYQN